MSTPKLFLLGQTDNRQYYTEPETIGDLFFVPFCESSFNFRQRRITFSTYNFLIHIHYRFVLILKQQKDGTNQHIATVYFISSIWTIQVGCCFMSCNNLIFFCFIFNLTYPPVE